ncbi:MAG: acyltransferase [Candidatus Roizmanbacteria bacterium]|nr:MAG: acyltransferase [Candidatus Roizmanbacteria bacterium]
MNLPIKDKDGKNLSISQVIIKIVNRFQNILLEFQVFLLHLISAFPCHFTRRFFYRLAGIKIGSGSTIHIGARFYEPSNISIGADSIIGEGAVLDGRETLKIGNHVDIATDVMIYNSEHDVESESFAAHNAPVIIEDYVFIGPRAIILPGITISKGAVVGAGAVVTKDVPPFAIVGGVPAKIIGERKNKELRYKLGRARWFR